MPSVTPGGNPITVAAGFTNEANIARDFGLTEEIPSDRLGDSLGQPELPHSKPTC